MEKTVFYKIEKQFLLGAMKFFFKNWLPDRFNNGFHQQKTVNKRIVFHLDRKGFYSFCFCQQKPLLNQEERNFQKITLLLLIEFRGNQFLKSNFTPTNGTDFRTFFLLVKTIIEIRRNPIFKKYFCQGKLIPARGN